MKRYGFLIAGLATLAASVAAPPASRAAPAGSCTLTASPQHAILNDSITLTLTLSGLPAGDYISTYINRNKVTNTPATLTVAAATAGSFVANGMVLTHQGELFCTADYDVSGLATLTGDVISATTGQPLPGATVTLAQGGLSATADASGDFSIANVPLGAFSATASLAGYTDDTLTGTAVAGTNQPLHFVLNPTLPEGELRIVLTWSETPQDLDSHLFTTWATGETYHLFYQQLAGLNTQLDHDDTEGLGPETVTITSATPGHYAYGVNDYTNRDGSGQIAVADADVKVYQGNNLIDEYRPTNTGTETAWHVFDADISATGQLTITPVNTYSNLDLDTQNSL